MSNSENWNMCQIACWAVAALIGLLILLGTTGAVGFMAALMAGAAMAVFGGLVLTRLFCTAGSQSQNGAAGGDTEQKPVETKVKDSVTTAGETAKEAAKKTVEQVKDTGAEVTKTMETTADKATDAAQTAVEKADKVADDAAKPTSTAGPDHAGDSVAESTDDGARPEGLDGPREGKADDLKQIKGVGPKLEQLLNEMGFYHFDQIAGWSADEVAWVNENLKGFKGRVTRDNWIEQATTLAAGGETDFSKRVEDGNIY